MVDAGFLTGLPLYRCIDNFVCQAGVSIGRVTPTEFPAIADDPRHPEAGVFRAGYISFAGWSPHSRSVHFFVALAPATSLGSQPWETPFGFVSPGTFESTVRRWTTRYGEMGPSGSGPEPRRIERADGGRYLKTQFPELDYLIACQRLKEPALGDR
jgi:cyclophilin family peptidyl-prolyl cis-trans isomerase